MLRLCYFNLCVCHVMLCYAILLKLCVYYGILCSAILSYASVTICYLFYVCDMLCYLKLCLCHDMLIPLCLRYYNYVIASFDLRLSRDVMASYLSGKRTWNDTITVCRCTYI